MALLGLSGVVAANPYEYKLANGLKVVVKEDPRAPVVVSQIWYRAGSMDEVNGTTGVAHVLEHMMFKGTRKVPAGQFSKIIAEAGGRENAFTSHDYTAYFQQLQVDKLPLAFKLEADRMANLALTEREFSKEIKVVMEERRMRTDDNPQSLVGEQLNALAFEAHPYHHPIVGWMNDLENMRVEDARTWYRTWYAPNNATLVVVGDVKHDAVFRLAQQYFGPLKPHALPSRKPQKEPLQRGIKKVTVKAPAKQPYVAMAYRTPVLRNVTEDWEPYALEILAGVLDGYSAARLNQSLVRESRLANDVGAGYDDISRGPGLFIIDGTPSEGKSVAELEQGIRDQIVKLQRDGVSEEELQRVKAQVVAAQVYQRDSMFYQGMLIGNLESTGLSWRDEKTLLAKLNDVTAAQVKEVAIKYLQNDGLTVATLDPQPLDGKQQPQPQAGEFHVH
ncbi:M16 family metallopeptidase [Sulfurimicrobium lacus]|nr:pitrilysin family protein [Sulfurimicrobium lacus]